MKKEKIVKSNTKDNKELNMKKKFKLLKDWALLLEGILIVPIIIVIIILACLAGEKLIKGSTQMADDLASGLLGKEITITELTKEDIIEVVEKNVKSETSEVYNEFAIVADVISYILIIVVLNTLATIFKTIEDEGTPFTHNNVKYLKMIEVLTILLWIFGEVSLTTIIIVSTIIYILKYGCDLQQEHDETL